ncbi:MAG: hypothetical protein ACD_62C00256G0002 [uncultured bacterium]|nr:MAG: hypothetical protein ACD_62C00256G0002 [uncultured bacterium]
MSNVRNLAAGIFLNAELNEFDDFAFDGKLSRHTHNARALKTSRDGAVQILFAGYVKFTHDVLFEQERDLNGNIQCLLIDAKRGGVVNVVRASGFVLDTVDDVLARAKLHERGAIILAQFTQRGPHVANDLG